MEHRLEGGEGGVAPGGGGVTGLKGFAVRVCVWCCVCGLDWGERWRVGGACVGLRGAGVRRGMAPARYENRLLCVF